MPFLRQLLCVVFVSISLHTSLLFAQQTLPPFNSVSFNDSLLERQYYLSRLEISRVWSVTRGENIVVALIGAGCDIMHPDLASNIFVHSREIPNNNLDDDGNGKIDDVSGWDFAGNVSNGEASRGVFREDNTVSSPFDRTGTFVAGIIGAVGNNRIGGAGIAPLCRILPIKVFTDDANNTQAYRVSDAIQYAMTMGAHIIYLAYTNPPGTEASSAEEQAINAAIAQGIVVVAPAGDHAMAGGEIYPADYRHVIAVGSVNSQHIVTASSNVSATTSIFGYGDGIVSTLPGGQYGTMNGTLCAGAQIAGIAALMRSANALMQPIMIREQLRATSSPLLSARIGINNPLDNVPFGTRSASAFGVAVGVAAVAANNSTLSRIQTGGITLSQTIPYTLITPSGSSAQILGAGPHTVRLYVRNYLSSVNNVQIRLLPLQSPALVATDTAERVSIALFASNPTGGAQTAEFAVRLTPQAYLLPSSANPTARMIVEISSAGQVINYAVLSIPLAPMTTGIGTLALEQLHDMGDVMPSSSATRTFSLVHIGTTTTTLTSLALSGVNAGEFRLMSPVLPLSMPLATTALYSLSFSPGATASGIRRATLTATTRTGSGSTATITTQATTVIGTVRPAQIVIEDTQTAVGVQVGSSILQGFRLRNLSSSALDLVMEFSSPLAPVDGTEQTEFRFSNELPRQTIRLNAGETRTIPYLFVPITAGDRTTALTVRMGSTLLAQASMRRRGFSAGQSQLFILNRTIVRSGLFPADDAIVAFPPVAVGTTTVATVTVFNPMNQPHTITGITFSGDGADECSSAQQFPLTIQPLDSLILPIRITAFRATEKRMTVSLAGNFTHTPLMVSAVTPNALWLTIPRLSQEILSAPSLLPRHLIAVRSVRVGANTSARPILIQQIEQTGVGRTSSFTLGVGSIAGQPVTLRSVQFGSASFRLANNVVLPRTVGAGIIDTVSALFAPTQLGTIVTSVIATYSIGASSTVLADTALIAADAVPNVLLGYGGQPVSGSVQFGSARIGDQVPASIAPRVVNLGNSATPITVALSGASAREFVVVRPFPTFTAQPGNTDTLAVIFRPLSTGIKEASLVVTPQGGTPLVYSLVGRALPALSMRVIPRPTTTQTADLTNFNMGAIELGNVSTASIGVQIQNITAPLSVRLQGGSAFLLQSGTTIGTGLTINPDDMNAVIDSVRVLVSPTSTDTLSAILTFSAENTTQTIRVRAQGIPSTRPALLFNGVNVLSFDTAQVIGINDVRTLRLTAQNVTGIVSVTLPRNIGLQTAQGAQFGQVTLLTVPNGMTRATLDTTLTFIHVPDRPVRLVDSIVFTMSNRSVSIARSVLTVTARARYADGITQIGTGVFAPIMMNTVTSQTVNLIINTVRGSSATITIARRSTEATFQLVDRGVLRDSIILQLRQTTASNAMLIATTVTIRFAPTQEGTFTDIVDVSAVSDSVQYASQIALFASARPLIQVATPTMGVEFGAVAVGGIRARQVPIQIANMTDTVFVVRSAPTSAFSLSVGEAHRANQFFIPSNANQTADTLCAILFEPDAEQRYQDTLNFFQRGERVYMIVMGGNGSTSSAVSVQTYFHDAILNIAPSIVESGSAMVQFSAPNTQPLVLTILSVEGRMMYRKDLHVVQTAGMTIPITTQNLPTGMYFVVIDQAGKRYGAKMIVRR